MGVSPAGTVGAGSALGVQAPISSAAPRISSQKKGVFVLILNIIPGFWSGLSQGVEEFWTSIL